MRRRMMCAISNGMIRSLMDRLSRLERKLDTQATPASGDVPFVRELTRALLLSGDGTGLDRCIRSVITEYCETRRELRRVEEHPELSESVRSDISVGFQVIIARYLETFGQLGVDVSEVEHGSTFQQDRHAATREDWTDDAEKIGLISECIEPEFTWTNGFGIRRVQTAKVAVFSEPIALAEAAERRGFLPWK